MPVIFSRSSGFAAGPVDSAWLLITRISEQLTTGFGLLRSKPRQWVAGSFHRSTQNPAINALRRVANLLGLSISQLFALYVRLFRSLGRLLLWLLDWIDYLLVPRTLWKLLKRHAVAMVVIFAVNVVYRLFFADAVSRTRRWISVKLLDPISRQQHEEFSSRLEHATTYAEWREAATALDNLEGLGAWKRDMRSPDYDYRRIAAHLWRLRRLYDAKDIRALMWFLRSSISRNMVGITNHSLYDVLRVGTKELIEDYLGEVTRALRLVCESNSIPLSERFTFFSELRHSFGRSALMLSGGATLGLFHTGVIKALHEVNLLPRVISGSSVGSIIAAMVCTRTDAELRELFSGQPGAVNLSFFPRNDKNDASVSRRLKRLWREGHMMDISVLSRAVRANVPDLTFQEAHERTGRVLNIVVTPAASHGNMESSRVLNYLTAPNVLIWSACLASCAIPYVYEAVELLARNENGDVVLYLDQDPVKWEDGSFSSDLPKERLSELFNVNHFIVSQVNPHVVPFLAFLPDPHLSARPRHPLLAYLQRPLSKTLQYLSLELRGILTNLWANGLLPFTQYLGPMLSQGYVGHVTLLPKGVGLRDYLMILENPTEARLIEQMTQSQKCTWPSISLINNSCMIEFTLDDCVAQLRRQVELEAEAAPLVPRFSNIASAAAAAVSAMNTARAMTDTSAGSQNLHGSSSSASLMGGEGTLAPTRQLKPRASLSNTFAPDGVDHTPSQGLVKRISSSAALSKAGPNQREIDPETIARQQARSGILTHHLVKVLGPARARTFLASLYSPEVAKQIHTYLFGEQIMRQPSRKELRPSTSQRGAEPEEAAPLDLIRAQSEATSEASSEYSSSSAAAVAKAILANTAAVLGESVNGPQLVALPEVHAETKDGFVQEDDPSEVGKTSTPLEPLGSGRRLRYTRPPSQLVPSVARINDEAKSLSVRRKVQSVTPSTDVGGAARVSLGQPAMTHLTRIQSFVADINPKGRTQATPALGLVRAYSAAARAGIDSQKIAAVASAVGMDPTRIVIFDDGPHAPIFLTELRHQGSGQPHIASPSSPSQGARQTPLVLASQPIVGVNEDMYEDVSSPELDHRTLSFAPEPEPLDFDRIEFPDQRSTTIQLSIPDVSHTPTMRPTLAERLAADNLHTTASIPALETTTPTQLPTSGSVWAPATSLRPSDECRRISDTHLREQLERFETRNTLREEEASVLMNPIVLQPTSRLSRSSYSSASISAHQAELPRRDRSSSAEGHEQLSQTIAAPDTTNQSQAGAHPVTSLSKLVVPQASATASFVSPIVVSHEFKLSEPRPREIYAPTGAASAAGVGTYSAGRLQAARRSMLVMQDLLKEDIHCKLDDDIEAERRAAAAAAAAAAAEDAAAIASALTPTATFNPDPENLDYELDLDEGTFTEDPASITVENGKKPAMTNQHLTP